MQADEEEAAAAAGGDVGGRLAEIEGGGGEAGEPHAATIFDGEERIDGDGRAERADREAAFVDAGDDRRARIERRRGDDERIAGGAGLGLGERERGEGVVTERNGGGG